MNRIAFILALGITAFACADTIDDAEAKKRGVPVEQVIAERRVAETKPAETKPGSTAVSADTVVDPAIVYAGRPRTKQWLDEMFKKFGDKIACIDGKFYDVQADKAAPRDIDVKSADEIGDFRLLSGWAVLSVISDHELLLTVDDDHSDTPPPIYITNVDTTSVTDKQAVAFRAGVVRTGTYKYTSAIGAVKTVVSFQPYVPLTKDQFVEAIKSGLKLETFERRAITQTINGKIVKTSELVAVPVE